MQSRWSLGRASAWGLVVLTLAPMGAATGCFHAKLDTVPVSGKVTYQGNPVPWGTVKFQPADRTSSRPGVAQIQADGRYSVGTLENAQGLMPGQYRVTVVASKGTLFAPTEDQKAAAAKIKLPTPKRYTDPNTSGLTLTIDPSDGPKTFGIDLTD